MKIRGLAIIGALLLVACPATVTSFQAGSFGPVGSAIWLEVVQTVDGGEYTTNRLVFSSETGLCGRYQRMYERYVELQEDYTESWEELQQSVEGAPYDRPEEFYRRYCELVVQYYGDYNSLVAGFAD